MVKNTLAFFGTRPFFRFDARQRVLGKRRKGIVGLIGQNVAVGEEKYARPPRRLAGEIPAAMEQRPCNLKRDRSLARTGGERQQDALLARCNGLQRILNSVVFIISILPLPPFILERDGGEAIAPSIGLGEHTLPKLLRRWIAVDVALRTCCHVYLVDATAIG